MNETLAVISALAASIGAVLACLTAFFGFISLVRGGKSDRKIQEVIVSVDGKWTETLEVIAEQKRQIATLNIRIEEILIKSAKAEGVLEGNAIDKQNSE